MSRAGERNGPKTRPHKLPAMNAGSPYAQALQRARKAHREQSRARHPTTTTTTTESNDHNNSNNSNDNTDNNKLGQSRISCSDATENTAQSFLPSLPRHPPRQLSPRQRHQQHQRLQHRFPTATPTPATRLHHTHPQVKPNGEAGHQAPATYNVRKPPRARARRRSSTGSVSLASLAHAVMQHQHGAAPASQSAASIDVALLNRAGLASHSSQSDNNVSSNNAARNRVLPPPPPPPPLPSTTATAVTTAQDIASFPIDMDDEDLIRRRSNFLEQHRVFQEQHRLALQRICSQTNIAMKALRQSHVTNLAMRAHLHDTTTTTTTTTTTSNCNCKRNDNSSSSHSAVGDAAWPRPQPRPSFTDTTPLPPLAASKPAADRSYCDTCCSAGQHVNSGPLHHSGFRFAPYQNASQGDRLTESLGHAHVHPHRHNSDNSTPLRTHHHHHQQQQQSHGEGEGRCEEARQQVDGGQHRVDGEQQQRQQHRDSESSSSNGNDNNDNKNKNNKNNDNNSILKEKTSKRVFEPTLAASSRSILFKGHIPNRNAFEHAVKRALQLQQRTRALSDAQS